MEMQEKGADMGSAKREKPDHRFLRSEILLGALPFQCLAAAHVVVVGYGAVGSAAAEALVRSGVGHIRIIDADVYDLTNINRQLGAEEGTIGRSKVSVGLEHFKAIHPEIDAEAHEIYVGENTMDTVFAPFKDGVEPEIIIDAIDTLQAKVALIAASCSAGKRVYSSMGAARKTQPEKIKFADISKTEVCPLAREVRKRLKKMGIFKGVWCVYSTEEVESSSHQAGNMSGDAIVKRPKLGSLMTVTASFGLRIAAECIREITSSVEKGDTDETPFAK